MDLNMNWLNRLVPLMQYYEVEKSWNLNLKNEYTDENLKILIIKYEQREQELKELKKQDEEKQKEAIKKSQEEFKKEQAEEKKLNDWRLQEEKRKKLGAKHAEEFKKKKAEELKLKLQEEKHKEIISKAKKTVLMKGIGILVKGGKSEVQHMSGKGWS